MKSIGELKKLSYGRLCDCWGESVTVFFIATGLISSGGIFTILLLKTLCATGAISCDFADILSEGPWWVYAIIAAVVLIMILVEIPFHYGICWYLMQQIRGNAVPPSSIFSCFMSRKTLRRTITLELMIFVRKLIAALPVVLLASVEIMLAGEAMTDTRSKLLFTVVGVVLVLLLTCMLAFYFVYSMKYFLVPYLYVADPDKKLSLIISRSSEMMFSKESYLTEFYGSFIGWFLTILLIFPAIFIFPFFRMTGTAAAAELIDNYNKEQSGLKTFITGQTEQKEVRSGV